MAHYRAIAAVSATIAGMLKEAYPRSEFGNSLNIATIQPGEVSGLADEGIAVMLWRVTINTQRRNLPNRTDALGRVFKPSLPVDLSVMLLPYAKSAERQHRLLGWAMRALADAGGLTDGQLNHYLSETDIFDPAESIELVCDPLSVADYITLWSRIEKAPLSINYLVRMTLLDSERELQIAAPTIERVFEAGVAA